MALRACDIAAIGDMVLMRIPLEIFRSLGNSLDRFVAFETCLTGGRRCWLGLRMARITGETPYLMAVRRKAALFLDGGQSGPEHCYNCSQTKYPFKQAYLFLSHSIRDYTTVFQSRISNLELF